jgi:hypothetical protein
MQKGVVFERTPLWLVEGMAEYLSVGPEDAHTAMWLRDALQRNDLPTINDLTNSGRYFPYRYGEALWAFIGGTWGDEKVVDVFRRSLEYGVEQGIIRALGMTADTLSARWHEAIRKTYGPYLEGRTEPRATGHTLIAGKKGQPDYFVRMAGRSRTSIVVSAASSCGSPMPRRVKSAAPRPRPDSPRASTRSASSTRPAAGRRTGKSSRSCRIRTATTRSTSSMWSRRTSSAASSRKVLERSARWRGRPTATGLRSPAWSVA